MISKDLVAASAKPLILSILSRQETYGYEIIKNVKDMSGGKIEWTDGMLYPVLHRLEDQKLISSKWVKGENGRKRKYYFIEKEGSKVLAEEKKQWEVTVSTLNKVWGGEPCII